jgi:hypothetical protein
MLVRKATRERKEKHSLRENLLLNFLNAITGSEVNDMELNEEGEAKDYMKPESCERMNSSFVAKTWKMSLKRELGYSEADARVFFKPAMEERDAVRSSRWKQSLISYRNSCSSGNFSLCSATHAQTCRATANDSSLSSSTKPSVLLLLLLLFALLFSTTSLLVSFSSPNTSRFSGCETLRLTPGGLRSSSSSSSMFSSYT